MPFRPLPFREVKRRLLKAGFVQISQEGSHVEFSTMIAGQKRTVMVPAHREVAKGTSRDVLDYAGLSIDEWDRF